MKVIPFEKFSFGCEIKDIGSFESPTEAEKAAIRDAFVKYRLIHIKGPVELQTQINLVSCIDPVTREGTNTETHSLVSTKPDSMVPGSGALRFHSDYAWTNYGPAQVLSLYGLEMEKAVPTTFADGVEAVRRLPTELRDKLRSMQVVVCAAFAEGSDGTYRQRLSHASRYPDGAHRSAVHPAIAPHPITGEDVLMVCQGCASHFVGMTEDESDPIFEEIEKYQYSDDNVISHYWQVGDLVIWDNFGLQHGRAANAGNSPRTLRRVIGNPIPATEIVERAVSRFQT